MKLNKKSFERFCDTLKTTHWVFHENGLHSDFDFNIETYSSDTFYVSLKFRTYYANCEVSALSSTPKADLKLIYKNLLIPKCDALKIMLGENK